MLKITACFTLFFFALTTVCPAGEAKGPSRRSSESQGPDSFYSVSKQLAMSGSAVVVEPEKKDHPAVSALKELKKEVEEKAGELKKQVAEKAEELKRHVAEKADEERKEASEAAAKPKAAKPVKPGVQRGDPKTAFSQGDNRYHSAVQRERLLPDDPEPEPDPTPEPEPEPEPEIIQLMDWMVANQFQSSSTTWSTIFEPLNGEPYDQIVVVYDMTSLDPLSATAFQTAITTEFPDLAGTVFVIKTTALDGSTIEWYGVMAEDMTSIGQIQDWIQVKYDPSGQFYEAVIRTVDELPLDSVSIPPLAL